MVIFLLFGCCFLFAFRPLWVSYGRQYKTNARFGFSFYLKKNFQRLFKQNK